MDTHVSYREKMFFATFRAERRGLDFNKISTDIGVPLDVLEKNIRESIKGSPDPEVADRLYGYVYYGKKVNTVVDSVKTKVLRMQQYLGPASEFYCRKWAAEILIKFREAGYKTEVSVVHAIQAVFPNAGIYDLVCFYEGANCDMLLIEMAEVAFERLTTSNT